MAEIAQNFPTGLVLGKFYPLTRGHQFLIESALSRCDRLYVAIGSRPSESIPPETRAAWIRELYPNAIVVVQPQTLPYFPEECATPDEFYRTWTRALQEVCGGTSPAALFTSEDYGEIMARYLRCAHVMVDKDRAHTPISATRVRANPFACWDFLDPVVRAYFVKTVCIFGPESTGKTTLCENLARHFNTLWQPEFARAYLGERHCDFADMEPIALGHMAEFHRHKRRANKLLFMDTDAITTAVFSRHYYNRIPETVRQLADTMKDHISLYLFTDIDVPWVPDTSRDLGAPHQRQKMKQALLQQLESHGLTYVMISGTWEQRLQTAVHAVQLLM